MLRDTVGEVINKVRVVVPKDSGYRAIRGRIGRAFMKANNNEAYAENCNWSIIENAGGKTITVCSTIESFTYVDLRREIYLNVSDILNGNSEWYDRKNPFRPEHPNERVLRLVKDSLSSLSFHQTIKPLNKRKRKAKTFLTAIKKHFERKILLLKRACT